MNTEATNLQSDDHGILPSSGPRNIESETAARDHQLSNKSSDNIDIQTPPFSKYPFTLCQGLGTRNVEYGKIDYSYLPLKLYRDVPFAFFHEDCAKCSEFSGAAASACSTCAHLRPWHLLFHAAPEYESILGPDSEPWRKLFFVRLGKLREIRIRALFCGFCDFIAKHPSFLRSLASNTIDILFDESGMMLFMEDSYVGDLRLDTQTTPTPPDYRRIDWETNQELAGVPFKPAIPQPRITSRNFR